MSDRKRGQSRIIVKHAPGFAGYIVVDRVAHTASRVYDLKEQAERRARRMRAKLGKKPAIGTPTANPKNRA